MQYFSPQKAAVVVETPKITLQQGTVRVAKNFQVNVIDASSFMGKKVTQAAQFNDFDIPNLP